MGDNERNTLSSDALPRRKAHNTVDELALTSAISGFATALAARLDEEELGMALVILSQLRDTLATIAVQRAFFEKRSRRARKRAEPAAGGEAEGTDD